MFPLKNFRMRSFNTQISSSFISKILNCFFISVMLMFAQCQTIDYRSLRVCQNIFNRFSKIGYEYIYMPKQMI